MFFPRSLDFTRKKISFFSFAIYNLVIFLHSLFPRQPPLHLRSLLPGDAKQLQPATHRTGEPKKYLNFPHNVHSNFEFISFPTGLFRPVVPGAVPDHLRRSQAVGVVHGRGVAARHAHRVSLHAGNVYESASSS